MILAGNEDSHKISDKFDFGPIAITCMFVCVEVLRPSQPSGVMSSAVSLPKHAFTGQA